MDDLDWDALFVDPHEASVAQGRQEGRQAGQEAGYQQGRKLGQTTAIEYGMEIGFISGILEALEKSSLQVCQSAVGDNVSVLLSSNVKARKTLGDLRDMVSRFPDAQAVFQQKTIAIHGRGGGGG